MDIPAPCSGRGVSAGNESGIELDSFPPIYPFFVETANAFAEFSFKNLHRFERLPDLHCRFEPAKEVRQPPFPDMLREIP